MVDTNKGKSAYNMLDMQDQRRGVRNLMDDIDNRRKSLLQTQSESEQSNRINRSVSLSGHGVSVNDSDLKNKYDMASRTDEAAALIVDYKKNKGEYITGESADIIKNYIREKDDQGVYDAFYNYMHNPDADKYDFLVNSGLEEPNQEDRGSMLLDGILNTVITLNPNIRFLKDVGTIADGGAKDIVSNLYYPIRIAGKGLRQGQEAFENMAMDLGEKTGYYDWARSKGLDVPNKDAKKEENAILEYTLGNTDFGLRPSEEDWSKAEEEIMNDPAILNRYKKTQNIANATMNTVGGGLWAIGAASSVPVAMFHGLLSAGMEIPSAKGLIQAGLFPISFIGELGDLLLSSTPGINKVWDMLDEDAQMFLKYAGGTKVVGKALMTRNPETGKMEIRESIRDFMKDPIGNIQDLLNRWSTSRANKKASAEEYKNLKTKWKAEDEMLDTARQIGDTETEEQAKFVSNALSKLDEKSINRINKYEELIDELNELERNYLDKKWDILQFDKRKVKEGDGLWDVTMKNEYGQTIKRKIDVPSKMLDILDKVYQGNPIKEMEIELMRRQYRGYGLTRYHIGKLAAEMSKAIKIYKEGSKDMVDTKFIENEVEPTRRAAMEFIREPFKDVSEGLYAPLNYLDRAISDIINSNALFSDIKESVGEYKGNIPRRENWQKARDWSVRAALSRGRSVISDMIGEKAYNPLTREQDLPKNLKYFNENKSKLPKDETIQRIDEWIKDTNTSKSTAVGDTGPVEGEVIEPKRRNIYDSNNYLEDILIDVEPYVIKSLIEDPKYNGLLGGIDYTRPIRITPEGYAANYGETLESYKGKNREGVIKKNAETLLKLGYKAEEIGDVLKEAGWEEAEISEVKKAADAVQESLFGEIEGGKRKDRLGRDVLRKGNKNIGK